MSTPPPTPAGWHPHPSDPALLRYWDGTAWTDHTAPATAAPPVAKAGITNRTKWILIGAGTLVGLIVVSNIANAAINGARPMTIAAPLATSEPSEPTPTPTPSPTVTPVPTTPPAPVIDVAAFKSDSYRDLDDYEKDLNDMVTTVNEGGFWRLLSNSGELAFNLGQLQTHDAPTSVAAEWATNLVALDTTLTGITDVVSADDPAVIMAAIEASRAQVNVLRGIVDRAA